MKAEFKKLTVMTRETQRKALAESMQAFGLLHLEQKSAELPGEAEQLIHERNRLDQLVNFINEETWDDLPTKQPDTRPIRDPIAELLQIESRWENLHRKRDKSLKEAARLEPWGSFNSEKFEPLRAQGLHIYLGQVEKKNAHLLKTEDGVIEFVRETSNSYYFAWIGRNIPDKSLVEIFPLPNKSTHQLKEEVKKYDAEIKETRRSLTRYRDLLPSLKAKLLQMNDAIKLLQVEENFDHNFEGKFISLISWFPANKEEEVEAFVEREKLAWRMDKPSEKDDVPVLLKNKRYPGLFEPITKIFELPNYYETDLTPFLAVFYPILFAYCLGDSGYGAVLTISMVVGYFTFFKSNKNAAILGIILGVVTTFMGFIKSGSLFGIMLLPDHPVSWIRYLAAWVVIPDDSSVVFNAFNVALMIGVIQIITGILISIYNSIYYQGFAKSLMPIGKLLIVTSLIWIFLADMQEVAVLQTGGKLRRYLLILGVLLVVFFHQLEISIPKRLAQAFLPLFFIFTGILGDILSYVRLFALGLASSVLGLVVNQIGMQIMEGNLPSVIVGILFLLFGHTLNFGIAALGSFVHPLRLTFVEFYGNAGFQGKGIPYQPFMHSKEEIA